MWNQNLHSSDCVKLKTNMGKMETNNSAQGPVEDDSDYTSQARVYVPSNLQQVGLMFPFVFMRNHHTSHSSPRHDSPREK